MKQDNNLSLPLEVSKLIDDDRVEAAFLYGSYVNGYYREDSDIDVITISSQLARYEPLELDPNISLHYVHPMNFIRTYTSIPYAHLRVIPIKNKKRCMEISDAVKKEIIRRQIIKCKKNNISIIGTLDPIINFLLECAIIRPWRMKPIKRIFASGEAKKILRLAYRKIFDILEKERILTQIHPDVYQINNNFVFDDNIKDLKFDNWIKKIRESYFGWYYLSTFSSREEFKQRLSWNIQHSW